jgi:hypothetical protein
MSLRDRNISTWPTIGYNFWGITKCASTTVKTHLYEVVTGDVYKETKHTRIHGVVDYVTPEQALNNGLLNFAIVRQPEDRFFSMYNDLVLSRPKRGRKAGIEENLSVDQFISFLETQDLHNCDVHFRTQSSFIPKTGLLIIDVKYLENWPLTIPPVRMRKHTSKVKTIAILTQEQKDRVYNLYQEDYENLGFYLK